MSAHSAKARYVKAQPQSRMHTCHWPGCDKQVPPSMWGCRSHWFRLPKRLRDKIWAAYRPGQEVDRRPSGVYVVAAREAELWIEALEADRTRAVWPEPHLCHVEGCIGRAEFGLFGEWSCRAHLWPDYLPDGGK